MNSDDWISVEDSFPMPGQQVWTFGPQYGMAFAIFDDGKFYDGMVCTDLEYDYTVTHWMPMPNPPKDIWIQIDVCIPEKECYVVAERSDGCSAVTRYSGSGDWFCIDTDELFASDYTEEEVVRWKYMMDARER